MHLPLSLLLFFLTNPLSATPSTKPPSKNAILLSNVKTLTLHANKPTTHRRLPAIPQLTCRGSVCRHHTINTLRCTNMGSSYSPEDIEWSCVADLPAEFKLGSTEVMCEGYGSSEDKWVLKGSCGAEYRLLLTEKGEERYGGGGRWGDWVGDPEGGQDTAGWVFMVIFVAVVGWILWGFVRAWLGRPAVEGRQGRRHGGGGWDGGGGGGGGGDPYDPHDPPPPYPGTGKTIPGRADYQGWRPGFLSGALGGAAAGYLASNINAGLRRQQPLARNVGHFGGGNGNEWGGSSSRAGSSGSNSGSSGRHESTGFGSTTRR